MLYTFHGATTVDQSLNATTQFFVTNLVLLTLTLGGICVVCTVSVWVTSVTPTLFYFRRPAFAE